MSPSDQVRSSATNEPGVPLARGVPLTLTATAAVAHAGTRTRTTIATSDDVEIVWLTAMSNGKLVEVVSVTGC